MGESGDKAYPKHYTLFPTPKTDMTMEKSTMNEDIFMSPINVLLNMVDSSRQSS